MWRVSTFAIVFAVIESTLTLSLALEKSTPAIKDSTVVFYWFTCWECPDNECSKCRFGNDPILTIQAGGRADTRALVGFTLPDEVLAPSSEITSCSIQFPPFAYPLEFGGKFHVFLADSSDWEEEAVSRETAPGREYDPLADIEVLSYENLGPIDVTPACQKVQGSADGQFSIYLTTEIGYHTIWSKDSGNPATLHVTYQ
ncbi:hypothetical protein BGW41_006532 [Actinomortierella wolfii]|nr:hypothetical protein BGW41_006532 [Actinomortierella wolfii]